MDAYYEKKFHGKIDYPFIVYYSVLPEGLSGVPLHWHEEMEIIYVIEGKINVSVQSKDYTVSKNEILLIHPQAIHSIRQVRDERAVYFNILFRFSMLSGGQENICRKKYLDPIYKREIIMPEYLDADNPLRAELEPLIQSVTELNWPEGYKNELLLKARLLEIMHIIKNNCKKSQREKKDGGDIYEKLKKSLLYLESNFNEHISVAQAAKMSNFSESYFSKIFRQLTGESFAAYLKNYRLERAADKLRESGARVSETAVSVGFNNLSYFTRAFREKYGVTPKMYQLGDSDRKL